jgi:hypothetical protein
MISPSEWMSKSIETTEVSNNSSPKTPNNISGKIFRSKSAMNNAIRIIARLERRKLARKQAVDKILVATEVN